jgi:hypothetical protein
MVERMILDHKKMEEFKMATKAQTAAVEVILHNVKLDFLGYANQIIQHNVVAVMVKEKNAMNQLKEPAMDNKLRMTTVDRKKTLEVMLRNVLQDFRICANLITRHNAVAAMPKDKIAKQQLKGLAVDKLKKAKMSLPSNSRSLNQANI